MLGVNQLVCEVPEGMWILGMCNNVEGVAVRRLVLRLTSYLCGLKTAVELPEDGFNYRPCTMVITL